MKKIFLCLALSGAVAGAANLSKPPAVLRLEVRAAQNLFEPFPNGEAIRLYLRSTAPGYLTIYHIHPDSGFAILYPQPQHHWRELEAKKEYSLADLAEDLQVKYPEVKGYVYLGFIITAEPIHLVPWLEQAFAEHGIKSGEPPKLGDDETLETVIEKVETDVRFRMGEAQTSSFVMLPILIQPRFSFLAQERMEPPKPLRYFSEGRYYFIAPEPAFHFPDTFERSLFRLSPRRIQPGANAIAPSVKKDRPNHVKPPRREE